MPQAALRLVEAGPEVVEKPKGADVVDIQRGAQEGFWVVDRATFEALVQKAIKTPMTPEHEAERWEIVKDMPQTD